jgi:hypothetical protein
MEAASRLGAPRTGSTEAHQLGGDRKPAGRPLARKAATVSKGPTPPTGPLRGRTRALRGGLSVGALRDRYAREEAPPTSVCPTGAG